MKEEELNRYVYYTLFVYTKKKRETWVAKKKKKKKEVNAND